MPVDGARASLADADTAEELAAADAALVKAEADRDAAVAAFNAKRGLADNAKVIELFPQVVQHGSLEALPVSRC